MAAAWFFFAGPVAATPTLEAAAAEPKSLPSEHIPTQHSSAQDDDSALEIAIEALGAEWVAIHPGDDPSLREVLSRHRQRAVLAFGDRSADEDPDDASDPGDLLGLRDMLLESEFVGAVAAPVLEFAYEFQMHETLNRNAERFVAELSTPSLNAEPAAAGIARGGVSAHPETGDAIVLRMVYDFFQGPFGLLALFLVVSVIVARATVRVAVMIQRR